MSLWILLIALCAPGHAKTDCDLVMPLTFYTQEACEAFAARSLADAMARGQRGSVTCYDIPIPSLDESDDDGRPGMDGLWDIKE